MKPRGITSPPMEPDNLIPWLEQQAEKIGWAALSLEIGAKEPTVYGWWRRGRLPMWRRNDVAQARDRLERKEAAQVKQPPEKTDEKAA